MKTWSRLVTLLLSLFILSFFVFPVNLSTLAASDNTPPELLSITTTKSAYSSGENIEFIVRMKEMGPQVRLVSINFQKEGSAYFPRPYGVGEYISEFNKHEIDISTPEEKAQGIFVYKLTKDVNSMPSSPYVVSFVRLEDASNNTSFYYHPSYTDMSDCTIMPNMVTFSVNNTVREDFTPPTITNVTKDKTTVGLGDEISFTVEATDPSGIDRASIYIWTPSPTANHIYVELNPLADNPNVFVGKMKVERYMKSGVYSIGYIAIGDKAGSGTAYSPHITSETREGSPLSPLFKHEFTVINDSGTTAGTPVIKEITLSSNSMKPGETINCQVFVDDRGTDLDNQMVLYFNSSSGQFTISCGEISPGVFKGTSIVPINAKPGQYKLRTYNWETDGEGIQYFEKCNDYIFPKLEVESVFQGIDNVTLEKGSAFNAMSGVSAFNEKEGDMTSKIIASGSVDVNTPGLYLVVYTIPVNKSLEYYGQQHSSLNYYEFRWIGVTDLIPDKQYTGEMPLALTNTPLRIDAGSQDVIIEHNGKNLSSASAMYTDPGNYTANASSNSALAIIDNAGPDISYEMNNRTVTVKATDPAGIRQLKYLPDSQQTASFNSSGIDIKTSKSFVAANDGEYTVYAEDNFGNQSIKTITIAKPTQSQFTYSLAAKTYNGEAQGITVKPNSGVGNITAIYYNNSHTKPTNAGSYAVTVDVASGTQYRAINGLSLGTFTINSADISTAAATVVDMVWTGKQLKPTLTHFTLSGRSFPIRSNATITYGVNKGIGKGTIRIAGLGNFSGVKSINFKIVPKKNSISRIMAGSKQLKLTWTKAPAAQKITKYEILYRIKGSSKWKIKTYSPSMNSAIVKGLTKGNRYEVQIRCYRTVSNVKYYSVWSATNISKTVK